MTNIISKTETAEVLEAAADLLQDVGWCQGVSRVRDDHSGEVTGFCSVGAIKTASLTRPHHELLYSSAVKALAQHIIGEDLRMMGQSAFAVVAWNDDVQQRAGNVIDAMLHTAKNLRNEATPHDVASS